MLYVIRIVGAVQQKQIVILCMYAGMCIRNVFLGIIHFHTYIDMNHERIRKHTGMKYLTTENYQTTVESDRL